MKLMLPMLALALAGCAGQGEDVATRDQNALARELADRTPGEPQSCIQVRQSDGLSIVDRRTVVRRDGRTIWVNRLEADCPGLRPHSTLIVEVHGGQYCRLDRVRALEPGTSIPGPACPLQDWIPYRTSGG